MRRAAGQIVNGLNALKGTMTAIMVIGVCGLTNAAAWASDEEILTATPVSLKTERAALRMPPPVVVGRLQPDEALAAVNKVRADAGLRPLSLDPALTRAAHDHAAELAARDDISHYGVNGSTPVTRVAATGYSAVTTGEALAIGPRKFEEVLDLWLASPSHRDTLMQDVVEHAGLALVEDHATVHRTFWALVVAEPF